METIMMRKKEAFYKAKDEYNKAINKIIELCNRANLNNSERTKIAKEFDYGLQIVLYSMAIQYEGILNSEVSDAIKDLVAFGDIFNDGILDLSIPGLNTKVGWETLKSPVFNKNKNNHQNVLEYMELYVIPHINKFIYKVNLIDEQYGSTLKESTIDYLKNCIGNFGTYFAIVLWSTPSKDMSVQGVLLSAFHVAKYFTSKKQHKNKRNFTNRKMYNK